MARVVLAAIINIGKGVGNKQWYTKRVRPVPATGILSSSHFPEEFQGNFMICNAIGFLGVLQHKVKYNGADIRAEEIDPILYPAIRIFVPLIWKLATMGVVCFRLEQRNCRTHAAQHA